MNDIGKQVRELLPEYPHLWSRVIAWAEKIQKLGRAEGERDALKFIQEFFEQQKEPKG